MGLLTRGWNWEASIQIWIAVIVVATLIGSSLVAAIAWVRGGGLWSLLGLAGFLAGGLFWVYLASIVAQQLLVMEGTGAALVATRWVLLVVSLASFLVGSILAWRTRGRGGLLAVSALAFLIVAQACSWMFFGSASPHSAATDSVTLLVICTLSLLAFVGGGILAWRSLPSFIGAFALVVDHVAGLIADLASLSSRRIWALAVHNVLESVRRRMLLAILAVFMGLFLFAGWYLPSRPTEQVKVYVSFVFMASTLIAMVGCGLLASLSLPIDIREQTIHTVVTKPVRRLEIVVGRIVGLTIVASAILLVMGAVSYIYLERSSSGALVRLGAELAAEEARGEKSSKDRVKQLKDDIAQIESKLTARVPIFGKLTFLDAKGEPKPAGISVGNESTYRSYIEGNKPSAAVWHFTGLPVSQLIARKEIPLKLTFTVFRTLKAQMTQQGELTGVLAELTYKNPKTLAVLKDDPFEVREYYVNSQNQATLRVRYPEFAQKLEQLFNGSDGGLDIEVRCLSGAQYLGMAQPDLYIMLKSASFAGNFAKGMAGVWLRVFLIICVAVTASTFLSAPVAMLTTLAVFVGAQCMDFLRKLALAAESIGGGPLEAARRLITHDNLQRPLDPGLWTQVIQTIDMVLRFILLCLTYVLPDLGQLNTAPLVANGFDISGALLVQNFVTAFAYAVPFTILGYLVFQSREIAQ